MKRTHVPGRGAALVAVAIAAVLLAGCKREVLDYRNAQMVNGKVYDGSANEPFSGKLTNVPDRSLLIEQAGYQLTAKLASIALADSVPATERNAQSFLGRSGAETLLSGAACDVQIDGGLPDGPAVCKAPQSEVVRIETSFKHGTLDGSFKLFGGQSDGTLLEVTFSNGQPNGTENVYSWTDHKLIHSFPWNNGIAAGTEEAFDPNTGALVKRATFVDGKYEGEVVHYSPDGKQIILKSTYTNGKLNGAYKEWDAAGTLVADKTYADGVEVGADGSDVSACVSEWDDAYRAVPGRPAFPPAELEQQWETSCRAGKRPSTPPPKLPGSTVSRELPAPSSCVDAWTAAYRREKGDDALVTTDQLGEWQFSCNAGKLPG
ncbi:toxin-antitoxin system YwqK family antitoxin [Burkholderia pseudomallei]|uniref:toxin-antitoxin system YwqK family antitoxin n=1 Tax=Burkholderia pseudomallei TaxID=28450 RepID=UPI000F1BCEBD|nr:toxin-antitoxin system YwqK family antitoxin [Burkholderia pseudomallei]VCN33738.1 lipoprotein [Burkholderia pseudomallei]VCN62286.1 lipoprotein [Burkholderia pseudomallei]